RQHTHLASALLSTASTTQSLPRTPTAVLPLLTASIAYSTWNKCPSGLKTVIARSYDMVPELPSVNQEINVLYCISSKMPLLLPACGRVGDRRSGKVRPVSISFGRRPAGRGAGAAG
ncbi:hypothetical protein THAOC_10627, partial [Thalassiosira oceanica]